VEVGNWQDIVEGQIVEVMVTGSNKGGLECQVASLRGFIPLGQLSMYRVETPEDYVGQRLACVVTEADRERRNLVLSHRAVMERERAEKRDKLLAELAPGQLREGIVRSLKDFGAFVDLDGADGLVHVSQLSWDRVNHPSEVLEVGQKIKVRVEKFDKDTGKISLSYREVGENPWSAAASKYYVGARVNGVISRLMDFGAFVKLEPGVEGLIHVSELAHQRVWRPSDVVSEGQEVEVKVLSVDAEKQRISLSLKALADRPKKAGEEKPADEDLAPPPDAPKAPRKKAEHLKGGIGGPSGGDKFGLNW
jgi:ribosomal protein S1